MIVNTDDLDRFIDERIGRLDAGGQDWAKRHLRRFLLGDPRCRAPLDPLHAEHLGQPCRRNLEQARRHGLTPCCFDPPAPVIDEVERVIDWIAALPVVDTRLAGKRQRIPYAQALGQARAWHERLNREGADETDDDPAGTEPVLALGDGWRWLRLTSEAALDYEGRRMRHCAGEGGYDRFRTQIFSLRDPANQPHCTVEFDPERARVQQARGRTNVDVPDRYMDHLAVLVEHLRPKRMNARLTEFAIAESGDILRVSRAADWAAGTRIRHHLVLTNRGDVSVLPEGLHVNGAMILANCALDRLPRNLTVCQAIAGLSLSPVTMLPDGLTVGALNLEDSLVKGLAPGTRVLGEMNMIHSLVHDLPPGLSVGKFLILDGDALGPLPDDLAVAGRPCAGRVPTRLPGGLVVIGDVTGADVLFDGQERVTIYGNLNFARWPHPELPRRLTVTGNLDLSRTDLPAASLDTRVDVAGDLILTDTPLPRLPDGWRVAGNVIR